MSKITVNELNAWLEDRAIEVDNNHVFSNYSNFYRDLKNINQLKQIVVPSAMDKNSLLSRYIKENIEKYTVYPFTGYAELHLKD